MNALSEMSSPHCTEVRFASLLSDGFTTMAVINPPEEKLANRTSVHCAYLVLVFFQQPMNNLIVICLSPFKTLYFKVIKITFGFYHFTINVTS